MASRIIAGLPEACASLNARITQLSRDDPAGIFALLMHADGAINSIVGDDDNEGQIVLDRGGEFLPIHQKVAVAGNADHRPLRIEPLHRHRGRNAIAHRA